MGRHAAEMIDSLTLEYLLSGRAESRLIGQLSWTLRKPSWRGQAVVETTIEGIDGTAAHIMFPVRRVWAPSFTFVANGVPVRRICVNGRHPGVSRAAHMHTYVPATGDETAQSLDDFPWCPAHSSLESVPLRDMFAAFCALACLDDSDLEWVDPVVESGGAR